MDAITASVVGSSVMDGQYTVVNDRRTNKRSENDNRKVEQTSFSIPL